MESILAQLGLDQTFFIQFAIFFAIFLIIPNVFFRPFQRLIEARHTKTVEDKEKATQLVAMAEQKFEEYRKRMNEERIKARAEFEKVIAEVKAEESAILGTARSEAKKITQTTLDSLQEQTASLKRSLEADVEGMALQISDILLKRQG